MQICIEASRNRPQQPRRVSVRADSRCGPKNTCSRAFENGNGDRNAGFLVTIERKSSGKTASWVTTAEPFSLQYQMTIENDYLTGNENLKKKGSIIESHWSVYGSCPCSLLFSHFGQRHEYCISFCEECTFTFSNGTNWCAIFWTGPESPKSLWLQLGWYVCTRLRTLYFCQHCLVWNTLWNIFAVVQCSYQFLTKLNRQMSSEGQGCGGKNKIAFSLL